MKTVAIAGLLAVLAIGGAFSAFAATRTVETSVDLELELWVDLQTSSAFVSTRQQGHEWITHDVRATLSQSPAIATLLVSDPVSLSVPVTVEVEVDAAPDELPFTPLAPATPHLAPGEAPSGRATCCRVRGMWDNPAAQRAVVAELRKVIAYAGTNLGLTHQGPITVNISHTPGGLLVRYEDAFEEALDELPSECSFQRGGHLFIGPRCRSGPGGDREGMDRPRGAGAPTSARAGWGWPRSSTTGRSTSAACPPACATTATARPSSTSRPRTSARAGRTRT